MAKFELEIVSCLENREKVLRSYAVQGIQTVGVFGDEPYGIRFTNNTNKRVEVKLSVDGTDVMTGQKANKDPHGQAFIVEAKSYRSQNVLFLKAWVESMSHGGRFVFTTAGNAVAAHTHGDLYALGFISALVFEEGYIPPVYSVTNLERSFESYTKGVSRRSQTRGGSFEPELESLGPSTGVGETIEQKMVSVSGLRQPVESELVQVRYLWWDELKSLLKEEGISPNVSLYPTGFIETRMANLGETPRLGTRIQASSEEYQRFL